MATLTDFENSLLPSATPQLPRSCATQCAGAAFAVRRDVDRGILFAAAITRVTANTRHAKQLSAWGQLDTFKALTGP